LLSEPFIIVNKKSDTSTVRNENIQSNNNKMFLDMEAFEIYVFHLRELYTERQTNDVLIKVIIH
jgi:hypothetical protein